MHAKFTLFILYMLLKYYFYLDFNDILYNYYVYDIKITLLIIDFEHDNLYDIFDF